MEAATPIQPVLANEFLHLIDQRQNDAIPKSSGNFQLPSGRIIVILEMVPEPDLQSFHINSANIVETKINVEEVVRQFSEVKLNDMTKQSILVSKLISSLGERNDKWELFFTSLKVDYHVLKAISEEKRGVCADCFREALIKWLDLGTVKSMNNQQKEQEMIKALKLVGSHDIAKTFKWPT